MSSSTYICALQIFFVMLIIIILGKGLCTIVHKYPAVISVGQHTRTSSLGFFVVVVVVVVVVVFPQTRSGRSAENIPRYVLGWRRPN